MSQPIRLALPSLIEGFRAKFGPRAAAICLTLLLEGLLVLVLLTLAPSIVRREEADMAVFSLDAPPDAASVSKQDPAPSERKAPDPNPAQQQPEPEQAAPQPVEPQPAPLPPPVIQLSREQMAAADVGAMRPAPRRPMVGPPDT
ncbi:MAG: hypothetical protein ACREB5_01480, partial [Sphingomonadaceae bacterium]